MTYFRCMAFTALHRANGVGPGPITDELLNEVVASGTPEATDLDWKSRLPMAKGITQTDFPKDVAAMANSGGGVIVYGVEESQKAATGRVDAGECSEVFERSLRHAAITAISPPVFGLRIHRLTGNGQRAVIVEIPPSVDGPHLIYKNDFFGAPIRNDADTIWMKEWQIEAMYKARFDERRHATEALDNLFGEAIRGHPASERAWFVAVAHPTIPHVSGRLTRDLAQEVLKSAQHLALTFAPRNAGIHPFDNVDVLNPRPGLRRWVVRTTTTDGSTKWKEAWLSIHHDGSCTLAAAVGGHPQNKNTYLDSSQVRATDLECAVADFMGLLRSTAHATSNDEYTVRVGIEWTGEQELTIVTEDNWGHTYDGVSTPLHNYTPVETSVNARESEVDFHWHVHDLAEDCVNQGGISNLLSIRTPESDPAVSVGS